MHKIAEKEFTLEDFSTEQLYYVDQEMEDYIEDDKNNKRCACVNPMYLMNETIGTLNYYRERYLRTKDKKYWWQMIQLLPSSYNQTRNVMMNYEVLANIYKSRKNHKLDEWRKFCRWIKTLPNQELITGEDVTMCDSCKKQYDGCKCDCTNEYEKLED